MNGASPLISVVIPTLNQPHLVVRAARSALNQTFKSIEVIVVVDGPDPSTLAALAQIHDPRLLVRPLPHNVGPPEARNSGVREARGRWVALLDHDDEWDPHKLAIQLGTAESSSKAHPIVTCRLLRRGAGPEVVWPRRRPAPGEPMSEYLLRRTHVFFGEGLVVSSTILTSRDLLLSSPFRSDSGSHDDLDWILRASGREDTEMVFVSTPDPLTVWNRSAQALSSRKDWKSSFSWIRSNRPLVTPRAYASFLLTWVSADAVEQGDRSAFLTLLKEARQYGRPGLLDGLLFAGTWLVPQDLRRWLAGR